MNERGLTLIETLMYTALIGVVLTGFVSFALMMSSLRTKQIAIKEVNYSARTVMKVINNKSVAKQIVSPIPGSTAAMTAFLSPTNRTDSLYLSEGTLVYREGDEMYNLTGPNIEISDLKFINLTSGDSGSLGVSFKVIFMNNASKEFRYEKSFQTAVTLNN